MSEDEPMADTGEDPAGGTPPERRARFAAARARLRHWLHRPRRVSLDRKAYLVAIVGLVVAVLALVRDVTDVTFTPFRAAPAASISLADGSTVPYCNDLTGSVQLTEGDTLWLAIRKTASTRPMYFLVPVQVRPGDGTWTLHAAIGTRDDPGSTFELALVLIHPDVAAYLTSLHPLVNPPTANAYIYSTALPPGTESAPRVTVHRDAGPGAVTPRGRC